MEKQTATIKQVVVERRNKAIYENSFLLESLKGFDTKFPMPIRLKTNNQFTIFMRALQEEQSAIPLL